MATPEENAAFRDSWDATNQRWKSEVEFDAAAKQMLAALIKAESFIAGFEDDEAQEDMTVLTEVRDAIERANKQPTLRTS